MKKITINDEQTAQLNGFEAANEVCDANGKLVGYLISPAKYAELLNAKEEADIAELDRRAQDTDVGTLQELWKEIGVE
jgi:hypothetical protein